MRLTEKFAVALMLSLSKYEGVDGSPVYTTTGETAPSMEMFTPVT